VSVAAADTIPLWGETLALNFANTIDWSAGDEHVEPVRTEVLSTAHYSDAQVIPT
jgi:hypothetical protein